MTLKDFLSQNDRFAANSGCVLQEIGDGYARASLTVTDEHLNAGGVCQGGVYFTLADIAIAAVMNSHGQLTFGVENNIVYVKSARTGDTLTAEATEVLNHHKLPYVDVRITNQHGELFGEKIRILTLCALTSNRRQALSTVCGSQCP